MGIIHQVHPQRIGLSYQAFQQCARGLPKGYQESLWKPSEQVAHLNFASLQLVSRQYQTDCLALHHSAQHDGGRIYCQL
jgi:hypothetical protein